MAGLDITSYHSYCLPAFDSRWGHLALAHVGFVRGLGKARGLPPWMRCRV